MLMLCQDEFIIIFIHVMQRLEFQWFLKAGGDLWLELQHLQCNDLQRAKSIISSKSDSQVKIKEKVTNE